jgi:hypothetical protein
VDGWQAGMWLLSCGVAGGAIGESCFLAAGGIKIEWQVAG